jgi:TIR domain
MVETSDIAAVDAGAVDIFISYSRGDRESVAVLAAHLQAKGFRVWWDLEIPPSEKFDRVIARALSSCKIVLVAWSANSIDSDWVLNEADEGRRRKILLPVLLDTVEIPLGFRRVQACDLWHWKGDPEHIELRRLLFRIARMLGQAASGDGPPPDGPPAWPKYAAAGVLLALFAGGGFGGWQWKVARDFDALLATAEEKLGSGDVGGAEQPIVTASSMQPDHPALRALRTKLAQIRTQRLGVAAKPPATDGTRDCADCPELVVVPAGEFITGAAAGEEFYIPQSGPTLANISPDKAPAYAARSARNPQVCALSVVECTVMCIRRSGRLPKVYPRSDEHGKDPHDCGHQGDPAYRSAAGGSRRWRR